MGGCINLINLVILLVGVSGTLIFFFSKLFPQDTYRVSDVREVPPPSPYNGLSADVGCTRFSLFRHFVSSWIIPHLLTTASRFGGND